jgi:hypothetical protein
MIQELNDALLSCQGYRVTSDTIAEAECLIWENTCQVTSENFTVMLKMNAGLVHN